MEKIIVEVQVPALGRSFDFELPAQNGGRETADQLVAILRHVYPSLVMEQAELFDAHSGVSLDKTLSLAAVNIKDGSQLMLV